eukprot:1733407-Alexandrium_andersonii.AAC.1
MRALPSAGDMHRLNLGPGMRVPNSALPSSFRPCGRTSTWPVRVRPGGGLALHALLVRERDW